MIKNRAKGFGFGTIGAALLSVPVTALAQAPTTPLPSTPTAAPEGGGVGLVGVVAALIVLIVAIGIAVKFYDLKRKREEEGVVLQARLSDAERSARQALYLEPGLAVGHLLLGHVLRRQDQTAAAARAYREAEGLCRKLPPEALVPLAEGERAGALADVARAEWRRLERTEG